MAGKNGYTKGKASQTSAQKSERADFAGYVNISLAENDKVEFASWMDVDGAFEHAFTQSLERGYQYSLKFNVDNDAYTCSVSCWDVSSVDAGLIYTAHSGTPYGAIQKAVWVLAIKLKGSLQNGYVKRKDADVW